MANAGATAWATDGASSQACRLRHRSAVSGRQTMGRHRLGQGARTRRRRYPVSDQLTTALEIADAVATEFGTESGASVHHRLVDGWLRHLGRRHSQPQPLRRRASRMRRGRIRAKRILIKLLPLWTFHGDADNTVPVKGSRDMVAALKAVGSTIKYSGVSRRQPRRLDDDVRERRRSSTGCSPSRKRPPAQAAAAVPATVWWRQRRRERGRKWRGAGAPRAAGTSSAGSGAGGSAAGSTSGGQRGRTNGGQRQRHGRRERQRHLRGRAPPATTRAAVSVRKRPARTTASAEFCSVPVRRSCSAVGAVHVRPPDCTSSLVRGYGRRHGRRLGPWKRKDCRSSSEQS